MHTAGKHHLSVTMRRAILGTIASVYGRRFYVHSRNTLSTLRALRERGLAEHLADSSAWVLTESGREVWRDLMAGRGEGS
jgi:hypothetical protein